MPGEEELRQAALNVLQFMELCQWEVTTTTLERILDYSSESVPFSLSIFATEQPSSSSPRPPFIEVILTGENSAGNITDVSFSFGFTLQYSGNFSIDASLNQEVWVRHRESAMRNTPWLIQQLNPEEVMNSQTSRAFEFMSRLIQVLSTSSHPEV